MSERPDAAWLIDHFGMVPLPIEATLYVSTYRSATLTTEGHHAGTGIIGLYASEPVSHSLFHRLPRDEMWHFYGGDPFRLVLLHPDGSSEEVVLGPDLQAGHRVQHVVPAHVWQAGEMIPGGRWSLFGCTMAPGFSGELFESGYADQLMEAFPDRRDDIVRLGVPRDAPTSLPTGFV
jgi:predicted cupin superfamily sugar epimerase